MVETRHHGRLRAGPDSGLTGISRGSLTVQVVVLLSTQVGIWEKA